MKQVLSTYANHSHHLIPAVIYKGMNGMQVLCFTCLAPGKGIYCYHLVYDPDRNEIHDFPHTKVDALPQTLSRQLSLSLADNADGNIKLERVTQSFSTAVKIMDIHVNHLFSILHDLYHKRYQTKCSSLKSLCMYVHKHEEVIKYFS